MVLTLRLVALVVLLVTWEPVAHRLAGAVPFRVVRETPPSGDDRALSVRIDRDPIWHNVNYQAHVAEIHVVMTNQTENELEISGYVWLGGRDSISSNIEVAREVERYRQARPRIERHSRIEAGQAESGWSVVAVPYDPEGAPQLPTFSVKVAGYRQRFEAWR